MPGLCDVFKDMAAERIGGCGHGCCWMSLAPREVPVSLRPAGVSDRVEIEEWTLTPLLFLYN